MIRRIFLMSMITFFMCCGAMAQGGMKMRLQKAWLQDHLLWLQFRVKNTSPYDFRVGWMEFEVRRRHHLRRTAVQDIRLRPLVRREPSTIPGDSTVILLYGLVPRVIGKDKELVAELRENNNDRILRVVIRPKILLRVRREP